MLERADIVRFMRPITGFLHAQNQVEVKVKVVPVVKTTDTEPAFEFERPVNPPQTFVESLVDSFVAGKTIPH
jgi:hypothetical protein